MEDGGEVLSVSGAVREEVRDTFDVGFGILE